MRIFASDFETNNHEDDCRVWGGGIYDIYSQEYREFYNLNDFMDYLFTIKESNKIFYHNLKFDGNFIVHYLFNNGFKYAIDEKNLINKSFTTIISDKGQWYFLGIKLHNVIYRFYDSYKILPFKLSKLAEAFDLDVKKGSIDYNKYRPKNYIPTKDESEYLKDDCLILGKSLKIFIDELKLNKITIGANALSDYKQTVNFKAYFPRIKNYSELVKSYKGGFTYVNPKYQNKILGKILVLDVNSLYPYVMREKMLPFGAPVYFKGEYKKDFNYPLYISYYIGEFKLKDKYIPTLQLKHTLQYCPTEYIIESNGETVLCLTNVDYEVFNRHYEHNLKPLYGWKFRASNNLFKTYIDKWNKIKIEADEKGNKPLRTIAKLMNNNLGGKFGTKIHRRQVKPYLKDGVLKYEFSHEEIIDGVYLPVASFMTAYARQYTITAAQKNFARWVYSDTDSLHLLGHELPDLPIHQNKLGYWKIENKFDNGKFIRSKCYLESKNIYMQSNNLNIWGKEYHPAVAGLPDEIQANLTYDNFHVGAIFHNKKLKNVENGLILCDGEFTIKA